MTARTLGRRAGILAIALVFYYGFLIYPLLRLLGWLIPDWQPGTPTLLVLLVLPLALRIVASLVPNPLTRWLGAASLTWMGLCFQLFALVVALEVVGLVASVEDRVLGLAGLAGIAVHGTWAFVNAQVLKVRRVAVVGSSGSSGSGLDGRRLVQISDVHIGSRRPGFLRRIVRRINGLDGDAVLITGDLVDANYVDREDLSSLGDLRAPTYFTLGNHERYEDTERILDDLQAHGVRVLRNEAVDADPFQFIGIDDADARDAVARGLAGLEPLDGRYRVLLFHRPEGVEDAAAWGAQLMLSGHTHRGQIFPFEYIVKRVHKRLSGSHRVDGLHLYVSPGTGTWGPVLRTNGRCEVTLFEFGA